MNDYFNSCSIEQRISGHCGTSLEAEWEEDYCRPEAERIVAVYNKTHILGLGILVWEMFSTWASNSRSVEEVWANFKAFLCQGIEQFVPYKTLRRNVDPEYYNREVIRLKVKVRKEYHRRILEGISAEKI
jgi:hypothetical protein